MISLRQVVVGLGQRQRTKLFQSNFKFKHLVNSKSIVHQSQVRMVCGIDIKDVRANPEKYKTSEIRRFRKEKGQNANLVDEALAEDAKWKKANFEREQQKKFVRG